MFSGESEANKIRPSTGFGDYEKLYQRSTNMLLDKTFDWDEVDTLITILQTKGICYLIGDNSTVSEECRSIDSVSLLQRLAACGYPLVENASISLFILHPELASDIVEALQRSEMEQKSLLLRSTQEGVAHDSTNNRAD
jgi:hypothetical protein